MDGRTFFGSKASIHRKAGPSGKTSPFWQAKFRGADGRTIWRSTKQTDHRKATAVARKWEIAARLAASSELTQAAAVAEVERTRYLSASDRIKLRNAFENNTAVEIQRRLQYRIANSSEQSHRYRP